MHFSPGIAQGLQLRPPDAQSQSALYFYASCSTLDHNPAKQTQIWTNLPTQQNDHSTQSYEWTAIPFSPLCPTVSSNPREGRAGIEAENQVQVAEIALDPLHDWASLPQQYEYTIRIQWLESGEVEWLENGGRNGQIVFARGAGNGFNGVGGEEDLSRDGVIAREEKEAELTGILRELENNGKLEQNESDFFKLLKPHTARPRSNGVDMGPDATTKDHFPFLGHRISQPLASPASSAGAVVLSRASHDDQVVTIGLWNPSDSSTAEDIIDLLDISDALSSTHPNAGKIHGQYLVTAGNTNIVVDAEEINSIKNRIFARPVARIVLLPGEYIMMRVCKVTKVESSVGDGKQLAVAILGMDGVDGFEFNDVAFIQLHSTITSPSVSTSIPAEDVTATGIPRLPFPSAKFIKHPPSPPPIPRVFLLPLFLLTVISSTSLADPKSDPKSDLLDLLKDLVTSPFVTTWNEGMSVLRFLTAMSVWIFSVALLKGVGKSEHGAVEGKTEDSSVFQDIDGGNGAIEEVQRTEGFEEGFDSRRNDVASTAGTLAITLKSTEAPLRLYFPSPNDDERLSCHSIIKITFDKESIDDSRILTERTQDGSGMIVSIDCRTLGVSNRGVVEISC